MSITFSDCYYGSSYRGDWEYPCQIKYKINGADPKSGVLRATPELVDIRSETGDDIPGRLYTQMEDWAREQCELHMEQGEDYPEDL